LGVAGINTALPMPAIEGYELHREIGAGGMARVYLATQKSLDRKVALKVMAPMLVADPNFSKRFLREARMLANLTNPNIVAVYEVSAGEHNDLHYFAMQHLENGDFAQRIRAGMSEAELVRVLTAIAKALAFAHGRGVIHRDVTPGNILFDSANNPVLTDFGIARSQHSSTKITHTGVSIGTSSYMSPEQARGGDVDARSDLYSLGALTFEALTGHPPYQGVDGFAVAYAHVFEPIPRLPAPVAHWQPFLDKVLAKDPEERFATGEQFTVALSDVPISAQRKIPARALISPASQGPETLSPNGLLAKSLSDEIRLAVPKNAPPAAAAPAAPAASAPAADAAARDAVRAVKRSLSAADASSKAKAEASIPAVVQTIPPPKPQSQLAASEPTRGLPWPWIFVALSGIGAALAGGAWWYQQRTPSFDPVVVSEPARPPAVQRPAVLAPPVSNPSATTGGEPSTASTDPSILDALQAGVAAVEDAADGLALPALAPGDPKPGDFGPPTRAEFIKPILANAAAMTAKNQCYGAQLGAVDVYRQALAYLATSPEAKAGIAACQTALLEKVDAAIAEKSTDLEALAPLMLTLTHAERSGKAFGPTSAELKAVTSARQRWITASLAEAKAAEPAWDWKRGSEFLALVQQLDAKNKQLAAAQKRLDAIAKPGFQFRDALKSGGRGPELRILGSGKVSLRDAKGTRGSASISENFAIARYETTLGEYKKFLAQSGHRTTARGCSNKEDFAFIVKKDRTFSNPGFTQTDSHPAVCVGYKDAVAYVQWLSAQTGERYRLLSEAEWQYAARQAGTPSCGASNLGDQDFAKEFNESKVLGCSDGFAGTAPVGRFGGEVTDLLGNVREWVADCRNDSLAGHPGRQSAWEGGNCRERMALGTAWISGEKETTAIVRKAFGPEELNNTVGFRVARDVIQRD
jgi:serine/threonine-protein kinase PpkA